MTVKHTSDVLIIGAGPAGSTLGYLLAEKGMDVLIFDKEKFPRPKLCGGVLTWKTRKLLEEVFKTPFVKRFVSDSTAEDYAVYEKDKQKIFQSSPQPFYFVDRKKYDAALVSLAREKGCRFLFGQQAIKIDFQTKTVYTRSGTEFRKIKKSKEKDRSKEKNESREWRKSKEDNKLKNRNEFGKGGKFEGKETLEERNEFTAKVIVGADGVNSVIRTRLFPGCDFHHNSGLAFQLKMAADKVKPEYRQPIPRVFLGGVRWGYGWIFPHGQQFVVGLWGLIRKNRNVKDNFLNFLVKVTGIDVENLPHPPSHLGPAGNFMETPGEGNVLLVGDAAGFADPLTGEGIYYAHKSAECAAQAILDFFESGESSDLLISYKSYLNPILKELKISLRFRDLAYSNLRSIGFFILRNPRIYFKIVSVVHGTKSYSQLPFLSR